MSWCDKLASTPTIGIRLNTQFLSGDSILDALSPLLSELQSQGKPAFEVIVHDSFSFQFKTEDGFDYGVDPSRVFVAFSHRAKVKPVSGGVPTMELLSVSKPFTQLLSALSKKLIRVTELLCAHRSREINRVGIIATSILGEDDLPPGIRRLITYMGRPWEGSIISLDVKIKSQISKDGQNTDTCMHNIIKLEDSEDALLSTSFDWQRNFNGRNVSADSLNEILKNAQKDSLKYFEDLGEGGRFDEEIICKSNDI